MTYLDDLMQITEALEHHSDQGEYKIDFEEPKGHITLQMLNQT